MPTCQVAITIGQEGQSRKWPERAMKGTRLRNLVFSLCLLASAVPVCAQGGGEPRGRASGSAGVSLGDGGVAPSFGAALSYWPTRHVGVELELAYSKNLEFAIDL